jgi:hypothetical protein
VTAKVIKIEGKNSFLHDATAVGFLNSGDEERKKLQQPRAKKKFCAKTIVGHPVRGKRNSAAHGKMNK